MMALASAPLSGLDAGRLGHAGQSVAFMPLARHPAAFIPSAAVVSSCPSLRPGSPAAAGAVAASRAIVGSGNGGFPGASGAASATPTVLRPSAHPAPATTVAAFVAGLQPMAHGLAAPSPQPPLVVHPGVTPLAAPLPAPMGQASAVACQPTQAASALHSSLQQTQPTCQASVLGAGGDLGSVARLGAGIGALTPEAALHAATVRAARTAVSTDQRDEAYRSFLAMLASRGLFDGLPLDASGALRVNLPFCHDFFEAPLLLPFLAERFLALAGGMPSAQSVAAFGCDLTPQPLWWKGWEAWAQQTFHSTVSLKLSEMDLQKSQLPDAALAIGLHPEVTNGGPWPGIIANVLRSLLPGGRCAFATFYSMEAEATAKVCTDFGVACDIVENPYYVDQPPDAIGTSLRYAVVVAGPQHSPQSPTSVQPSTSSAPAPTSCAVAAPGWLSAPTASSASAESIVRVPFCHELFETPLLTPFLKTHVLDRGTAKEISIYGCDVLPQPFWWSSWKQWVVATFGAAFRLELRQQDLSVEAPPNAALILGVHPEVTKGGPWNSIMANVVRSCMPGGRSALWRRPSPGSDCWMWRRLRQWSQSAETRASRAR
mmetsp:Transcript_76103/g.219822  ORF Transcript_76103/g.219822 Transcript_76103/m.219822 type:complete len:601 (+) Transcript_76103:57-1859(+)